MTVASAGDIAFQVFADGFCAGVLGLTQKQWDKRKKNQAYRAANLERLREHYRRKREEARAARPPRIRKGRDPEKVRARRRRYYERNREKVIQKVRAYREAKPMVYAELPYEQRRIRIDYKRKRRREAGIPERKHDAHVSAWKIVELERARRERKLQDAHVRLFRSDARRVYKWRYQHDAEFRLKELLRRQIKKKQVRLHEQAHAAIHQALCGKTKGGTIERLLGYTLAELRAHLERQFVNGMGWHVRGRDGWHIDHILPKRCFDLTTVEGVRKYWALSNLQPLWASDNLKKADRIEVLL